MAKIKTKSVTKINGKELLKQLDTIFDFSIAGYSAPNMQILKPYYSKVMRGIKNLKGYVYFINPKDYLDNSFAITNVKNEKIRHPKIDIFNLKNKFALPVLDIIRLKGLGRGRVLLCLKQNIPYVPIVCCAFNRLQTETWLSAHNIIFKTRKELENMKIEDSK